MNPYDHRTEDPPTPPPMWPSLLVAAIPVALAIITIIYGFLIG